MSNLYCCPRCNTWMRAGSVTEDIHNRSRRCRPEPVPSLKTRRRAALRAKLTESPVLFPLVMRARERIGPDQLRRVAEGRSDFAPSTWRRLAPLSQIVSRPRLCAS